MPWYFYVLEFVSGLLLTNGVPHFVQGVCGNLFQSPFGYPPGIGESSPLSNTLWGFANLGAGFVLLWLFAPQGSAAGWIAVALAVLLATVWLSTYFGRVRLQHAGKFSDHRRRRSVLREGFWSERLDGAEPRTVRIISMRARSVAGTCRCPG